MMKTDSRSDLEAKTAQLMKSLGSCFLYAGSSIALSLVNKAVLSSYNFKFPFFLLACQLLTAFCMCYLGKISGLVQVADINMSNLRRTAPVSVLFVSNVAAGFVGLRLVNIPIFLCLRRTATLFTLAMEFFVLGKRANSHTTNALAFITAGAVIAGWNDLNADYVGYIFIMLNNLCTALYLTQTKRLSETTGLRSMSLLYYNALCALPLSIVMAFAFGEVPYAVQEFEYWHDQSFLFGLFVSSCMGVLLTYAVALCTTANSPLATSVTGNTKDIITTALGPLLFGDTLTSMVILGVAVSVVGSFYFSLTKLVMSGVVAVSGPLTLLYGTKSSPASVTPSPA